MDNIVSGTDKEIRLREKALELLHIMGKEGLKGHIEIHYLHGEPDHVNVTEKGIKLRT